VLAYLSRTRLNFVPTSGARRRGQLGRRFRHSYSPPIGAVAVPRGGLEGTESATRASLCG
jgi:hypothetical protein